MPLAPLLDDPLSTDAEPAPPPADSLPRDRGGRPTPAREPAELSAAGLTWVNVVGPDARERRTSSPSASAGTPLDVEDIVSKRQRPKVDDYEEDGYLFVVLHFPVYDKAIRG